MCIRDSKNRSGEYFGFFDICGKFSSVMGPALMGFVTQIATVVLLLSLIHI